MGFFKEIISDLKKDLIKDTIKYFAAALGLYLLTWASLQFTFLNSFLLARYTLSGYSIAIASLSLILTASFLTYVLFNLKYQRLKKDSLKDELTGLYNEKGLKILLQETIDKIKNNKEPLSIILFDIDNFKNINDTYSMNDGDMVMRDLGYIFINDRKLNDISCRQHNKGDEFIVIARGFKGEQARWGAESKRTTISNYQFQISKGRLVKITVSCGVAEFTPNDTRDTLIAKADKAKQTAKRAGRNCSVLFDNSMEEFATNTA